VQVGVKHLVTTDELFVVSDDDIHVQEENHFGML
jgi:hypothetical protein